MTIGIYKLNFGTSDQVYIGQSCNIEKRFRDHIRSMELNDRTRANNKVLNAYSIYGLPSLEILEETSVEELTKKELLYIEKFDSIVNGLNILVPGSTPVLRGADNPNSLYTKEQYIAIVKTLIHHSNLPIAYIAELSGISKYVLNHISSLESHLWIKDEYPELWNSLVELKKKGRKGLAFRGIETLPILVSPNGIEYTISHLTNFAKEYGLSQSKLSEVIHGNRKHHKGWHLQSTIPDFIYSIYNTSTNETIIFYNGQGAEIAKSIGFTSQDISALRTGKVLQIGDWVLINKKSS